MITQEEENMISDYLLGAAADSYGFDRASCRFITYGREKNKQMYTFDKNKKPKSTDIIIQLFHTVDGKVIALNFGKDGYMVTIVPGQEILCEYDGKCLNFKG